MTSERWVVSDVDDYDQNTAGRPLPSLVSLHFVRSALRRRWWVCLLFTMFGLLMAVAYVLTSSTSHVAKAALVLAHDPQVDSSRAMSTDVSLLTTRTVANKTIASLGLDMTPDEFLQSVTADPVSSELLSLKLTGPSSAEAVRRLDGLTSTYLSFRAEQLSAQSNLLVDGMRQRIQQLQGEMTQLSKEIDRLANASNRGGTKLSDAIAQRAYVQEQIETLQQSIQDATLRNASVVSSSRVVDPAAVDTAGIKRRTALTLASGLIGGAALGCGIVLFFAITSDRLRRRSDVAAALEAPTVSVGPIAPLPKQWLWLPHLRTLDNHRADERQRLVRAIEMELSTPRRAGQLAVACIDNADEVRFAVATAAADLLASGCTVALIDLSERGSLVEVVPSVANSAGSLTVLRPRGVPALATGPDDLSAVGHKDGSSPSLELNDVTLVFADLDPSVGADHLAAWTQRVIVAVTTGRSSAEKVRTMAELVRTAGLDLRFAALLRTERTDDSSAVSFDRRKPAHLRADQDQRRLASEELVDHVQEMAAATTTAVAAVRAAEQEATAELTLAEEQVASEKQAATTEERVTTEKQPVEEDMVSAHEGATVAAEQRQEQTVSAEKDPAEEQLAADQQVVEGGTAAEEQAPIADEQFVATDDQLATDEPAADEPALPQEELRMAELGALSDMLDSGQERPTSDRQAVDLLQPAEEQAAEAEEPPAAVEPPAADYDAPEEALIGDGVAAAAQEATEDEPAVEEHASKYEQQSAAEEQADAADQQVFATDEQPATDEEQGADELATHEEDVHLAEQLAADEQAIAEYEPALEKQVVDEQQPAEEQPADVPQPVEEQPAAEEPFAPSGEESLDEQAITAAQHDVADEETTLELQVVAVERVAIKESLAQEQPAEDQEAVTEEQPAEESAPEEQTAEPDHVPGPFEEGTVDGWNLYIMSHPPEDGAPALVSEDDELKSSWDWDDLGDLGSRPVSAVAKADYDAAASKSENGYTPGINAEGDGRVGAEQSAGNGKEPITVARTRTKSRTRRSRRHK
jgi:hypothetical protein